MSCCYNCARGFSILNKEKACKNCGFGYCGNCLKQKIAIPKLGGEIHHVCSKCFKELSSPKKCVKQPPPPSALQRRLETLSTPTPTITVYKDNPKMRSLRRGLSKEDLEIMDRLERLHRDRKSIESVPTESEVADRLAKLKGMVPSHKEEEPYRAPDTRTQTEKSSDLLTQMKAEIEIDKMRPKPEDEIEARLAKLRGQDVKGAGQKSDSAVDPRDFAADDSGVEELESCDFEDVDKFLQEVARECETEAKKGLSELEKDKEIKSKLEEIQKSSKHRQKSEEEAEDERKAEKVLEGILAEVSLEEKLGITTSNEEPLSDEPSSRMPKLVSKPVERQVLRAMSQGDDEEELPWCAICNEDAKIRCLGCDGDLYCSRCFNECHDSMDIREHNSIPYKSSKKL